MLFPPQTPEQMKEAYERILLDIARDKVRPRTGRRNIRCVKRVRKTFPCAPKTRSRALPPCTGLKILK